MMDIAAVRKQHSLSQAEIAGKLGVHQTTILRWEKGELPMKARDELAVQAAVDQLLAERPTPEAPQAAA